jgi:NADH-quinone oxidoreductase subunit K
MVYIFSLIGIIINRHNLLMVIICLELMLLAINLILIITAILIDDILALIFPIIILGIAGAETVIGFGILIHISLPTR